MSKKKMIALICLLLLCAYAFVYFTTKVDITKYTITNYKIPQEFNDFKIVQLSDFHSTGYKDTTEVIIKKIKKINPDIIVMTGDMISWEMENIEQLKVLISSLAESYPIYYVDGNHEHLAEILKIDEYNAFMDQIRTLGIATLKNNYIEVVKDGEAINLYGIDIPLDGPTGLYVTEEQLEDGYVKNTLSEVDNQKFNILLAHNPIFINEYSDFGADLVLSGHIHGGIVRIPILGIGIASPEKEYFPKYDSGEFIDGNTTMIVNRGIGASSFDLRLFNKPEISVIRLKSK